jgi:hypothetical protein
MVYREEREFVLRLELSCEFPEDYQGEEDGYAWAEEIPQLAAEIVLAAARVAAARPGWKVRARNRGRPAEEEVTLVLEKTPSP